MKNSPINELDRRLRTLEEIVPTFRAESNGSNRRIDLIGRTAPQFRHNSPFNFPSAGLAAGRNRALNGAMETTGSHYKLERWIALFLFLLFFLPFVANV